MDWKLLLTTFGAVFVAELGDKTQLATLSFATGGRSRLVVFAGAALALVTTTAIAVVAGETVAKFIPPIWLRRAAGLIFIVLGVISLMPRGDSTP